MESGGGMEGEAWLHMDSGFICIRATHQPCTACAVMVTKSITCTTTDHCIGCI